jgi:hypothetical protein
MGVTMTFSIYDKIYFYFVLMFQYLIDTHSHNDTLARAKLRDNLYWISDMVVTPVPENATPVASENMSEEVTVWHNRLAHVNRGKISDMIRDKYLPPDANWM